jgi:hypothetical protein
MVVADFRTKPYDSTFDARVGDQSSNTKSSTVMALLTSVAEFGSFCT